MIWLYRMRMSPPRYRNAIQFARGHSAQFARRVGHSFSCRAKDIYLARSFKTIKT